MLFDRPAGANPIDQLRVVGQPIDRVDGRLKVTGTAPYAHEQHDVVSRQAHGFIVGAAIATGQIRSVDLRHARAMPGVITIVTSADVARLGTGGYYKVEVLAGPRVQHYHQAVAIVVAETFEQARAAAAQVRVDYARGNGRFDLDAQRATSRPSESDEDVDVGNFDTAFAAADIQIDQTYRTPDQSHAMMEPHATIAAWTDDRLTLWTSVQIVNWARRDLAATIGIAEDRIRIVSPFIGGGFGGKATVLADAVLASLASRIAGRPVRVALSRPLMFNNTKHRPATIQRIRLGAGQDGRLSAIAHESWSGNIAGGRSEPTTLSTAVLYAGANRMMRTRVATLDLPEGHAMRAPGEAAGMMALEIAMDELAESVGLDPVELRIRNDTQVHPQESHRRYSTRPFIECLRQGAERFGWFRREAVAGSRRDGRWIIGMGMASAVRSNPVTDSSARVRLDRTGVVTVETDMTDIGTGTYTIVAQTAAEMMGVPIERVVVRLGDSRFPESAGSGGQRGANSSTSAVYAACVKLREAVARELGFPVAEAEFTNGQVRAGNRSAALEDAAAAGEIEVQDRIVFGEERERLAHETFGAHFVEVGVDGLTGETRVRRMLAVCAAGRILNPKTARSQVIGAMTMGAGAALMEHLAVDPRFGFFVNHDLANYEVPVHADMPHQEVIFLEDTDPASSPMKAKGVGELGISGVAAAIANAIYNATGVRIRDYPLTLDRYLDQLPSC